MTVTTPSTIFNPPGPKSIFPLRYFWALRRDPANFLAKMAREYGDICYIKIGPRHIYLVNHPDYIRDILITDNRHFIKGRVLQESKRVLGDGLLTSEGEFHLRQRRLMQPVFHKKRIATYASTMIDYAVRLSAGWQEGSTLDISKEMMRLTMMIVGKTLLDTDVEKDATEIGEAMDTFIGLFNMMISPFARLIEYLPIPPVRRFKAARALLDKTIYDLIEERRQSGDKGDLLSMLLLTQDDDESVSPLPSEQFGSRMSDKQIRDEALTIFLAGHETTANALTWTWYLLSQHPAIEAKLHDELDHVLAGQLPTLEKLEALPYTRMILSEAMRLYPPAWAIGREATDECMIGGYRIRAGSTIVVSQWLMHRDARYYPNPLSFEPERWHKDAQAQRPKFSYFPFGGGSRICIGERFAWMEGILLIASIAQKWRLRLLPNHPVVPQAGITLRPKYGMPMILERR